VVKVMTARFLVIDRSQMLVDGNVGLGWVKECFWSEDLSDVRDAFIVGAGLWRDICASSGG